MNSKLSGKDLAALRSRMKEYSIIIRMEMVPDPDELAADLALSANVKGTHKPISSAVLRHLADEIGRSDGKAREKGKRIRRKAGRGRARLSLAKLRDRISAVEICERLVVEKRGQLAKQLPQLVKSLGMSEKSFETFRRNYTIVKTGKYLSF